MCFADRIFSRESQGRSRSTRGIDDGCALVDHPDVTPPDLDVYGVSTSWTGLCTWCSGVLCRAVSRWPSCLKKNYSYLRWTWSNVSRSLLTDRVKIEMLFAMLALLWFSVFAALHSKFKRSRFISKKKLDEPCSYRYWIFSFHGRGEQKAIIATTTHYEVHLNVLCYLYMRLYLEDSITNYLENSINRYFLLRWMKERRDSPTAATAAAEGYNKNWKNISF